MLRIGEYNGVSLVNGTAYMVWTGNEMTGAQRQETYFDTFVIQAPDVTPPTITATADKTTLWPPNGKLVPVTVTGTIKDPDSTFTASFHVVDEYGTAQPRGTITVKSDGTYSFTVLLQASRLGTDLDGRQYTIFIDALDPSGNTSELKIGVTVPHDQGN